MLRPFWYSQTAKTMPAMRITELKTRMALTMPIKISPMLVTEAAELQLPPVMSQSQFQLFRSLHPV